MKNETHQFGICETRFKGVEKRRKRISKTEIGSRGRKAKERGRVAAQNRSVQASLFKRTQKNSAHNPHGAVLSILPRKIAHCT